MQSVQLSIPKPCHQNWDKMTPTEQGRFCNACAKQVVDFTTMSDGEVLNFFLKNKDENVCGRTLPHQLDRVIEEPKPIVQSKLWYWKYAAAAGLLLMVKQGVGQSMEQLLYKAQFNSIETYSPKIVVKQYPFFKGDNAIRGYVKDEKGMPIPFAKIEIIGKPNTITCDANGFYFTRADVHKDELIVSANGYTNKNIPLKNLKSFDIVLSFIPAENNLYMLGGFVGGMSILVNTTPIDLYNVAEFKAKDVNGKALRDVTFIIKKNVSSSFDTIASTNGIHKIKRIKGDESFLIKVVKEGYVSKEIIIDHSSFNKRKGVFEITLERAQKTPDKTTTNEPRITIRGNIVRRVNDEPIYVLDGDIVNNKIIIGIKPETIEKVDVLKSIGAMKIYGNDGKNGAIIVTTKKAPECKVGALPKPDYKTMQDVIVNSNVCILKRRVTMGAVTEVVSNEINKRNVVTSDSLKQKILNLFSPIKIYPNPVQKGQTINFSFSNKYNSYAIQVVSVSGVVVLNQRRQNGFTEAGAFSKKITEQIIINPQWSSGYYLINILNEQGKVIAKDGFLVL
jgi:hypothetical protein